MFRLLLIHAMINNPRVTHKGGRDTPPIRKTDKVRAHIARQGKASRVAHKRERRCSIAKRAEEATNKEQSHDHDKKNNHPHESTQFPFFLMTRQEDEGN
jgi:hypothetical protein